MLITLGLALLHNWQQWVVLPTLTEPIMNLTILYSLDYFAELIFLTYQIGSLCRKYLVPAVAYLYVAIEFAWDYLTTTEYTLRVYNTPLTTGLCAT